MILVASTPFTFGIDMFQDRDIRLESFHKPDCLGSVGRFSNNQELRIALEKRP